ncbi:hypothetical protein D3C81_113310 [compost metagenome]
MEKIDEPSSNIIELNSRINEEVKHISDTSPLSLPTGTSKIISCYVDRIQGSYNVDRAKLDTESAVNLLYIAYNTTPQDEAGTRKKIEDIAENLKNAQKSSQFEMQGTVTATKLLLKDIDINFEDWREVREPDKATKEINVENLKEYLKDDLLSLAKRIKDNATTLKAKLDATAKTYDQLIKDIQDVSQASQFVLEKRLKDRAKIQEQILAMQAKEKSLKHFIEDLQADVKKYNDLSADYEKQAVKAEDRAYILSIIQIGAQVISAALPPIASALAASSSGGASVVASGALSTITHAKETIHEHQGDSKDSTQSQIAKMKEKTSTEEQITHLDAEISTLSKDLDTLRSTSNKTEHSENNSGTHDNTEPSALDKKITEKEQELARKRSKRNKLAITLASLSDSLAALDKGLGSAVEGLKTQASTLREMQMKLLDKAEAFEKEKRTQTRELDEISVLLAGRRSQEETMQLTVLSLNVSITALKRAKEIVDEISLFFGSFAAFMAQTIQENERDVSYLSGFIENKKHRKSALSRLIKLGDEFFICRTAEWSAINDICSRFHESFASSTQLSIHLLAIYLNEEELKSYLKTVPAKLQQIIAARNAASKEKIANISDYRKGIQQGVISKAKG